MSVITECLYQADLEKNVRGFLFPGAKQTVRNNEVSVLLAGVCRAGFGCFSLFLYFLFRDRRARVWK